MKNALLIFFLLFISLEINAQFDQDVEYVMITMNNGKVIKGIFKEMTSSEISYYSNGTYHTINRRDVANFKIGDNIVTKDFLGDDEYDYSDQYFLFQSALPAEQGNYFYRNYNVFLHQFTFGMNEHLSLSGGFESLSFFIDEGLPVLFFTPKLSFGEDNIFYSVSTTFFVNDSDYVGLASANMTVGDRKTNLTFGLSLGYDNNDFNNQLIFHLNGMVTLGRKFALVSELMVINEFGERLFDFGFRNISKAGIGFDVSLLFIDGLDNAIPVLALSLPFSLNN